MSFADRVRHELGEARDRWDPINSAHEGYAIILEEVDEYWEEVRRKRDERSPDRMLHELVQVAAMAQRTAEDTGVVERPFYAGGEFHERTVELLRLLHDAVGIQRRPCDHAGLGLPGCVTCDPRIDKALGIGQKAGEMPT